MIINPVIEREFKTKMRNWRSFALVGLYLVILCAFIYMVFKFRDLAVSYDPTFFMPLIAVQSYSLIAIIELLLILFIIPAITSDSICGEKERQTLDLMLCSNFSPYKIIWGKIVVSISQTLLLIIAASPFLCIVLLYGGIGLIDIAKLFGLFIMTALMVASFGIYFSCIFKKSMTATIATYLVIFIITIVAMISFEFWRNSNINDIAAYANIYPFEPTPTDYNLFMFANPFYGLHGILPDGSTGNFFESFLNINFYNVRIFDAYNTSVFFRPFAINVFFDAAISILLYVLAVERLKPIKKHLIKK